MYMFFFCLMVRRPPISKLAAPPCPYTTLFRSGRIEVRAIGIVDMPLVDRAPFALFVRLVDRPERMPADDSDRLIAGIVVPEISLNAHEASAPIKVELALARHSARA